jgi:hypothetical protein
MKPSVVIHLVHGTWPRGLLRQVLPSFVFPARKERYWFEPGSAFTTSLEQHLAPGTVRFRSFSWSGRNSQLSREKAALELQRYLRAALAESPGAAHYLVGHSHGGNVALLAVSDRKARFAEELRGVVCLATPFLTFLPIRGSAVEEVVRLLPLVLPLVALIATLAVGLASGSFEALTVARGIAFAMFLAPTVLAWLSYRRREVAKRYLALRKRSSPRSERLVAVLRSPGDEATLALALPQLVNLVSRIFWEVALRPILRLADLLPRRLALLLVVLPPLVSLGVMTLPGTFGRFEQMGVAAQILVGAGLLPVAGLIVSFAVLAPGAIACAVAVGPEMLIASFVQEVFVDSTPVGWRGSLECVVPERRRGRAGGGLRHSIYDSRRVRSRVAEAIRRDLDRLVQPAPPAALFAEALVAPLGGEESGWQPGRPTASGAA